LTDEDRKPWLAAISNAAIENLCTPSISVVVASCSALKVKYRDYIRAAITTANATAQYHIKASFIYPRMEEELATELVAERHKLWGHFMSPEGVRKQYEDLQEPGDEETDVFVIDANQGVGDVMEEGVRIAESLL
jgi:gluconokinase